MTPNEIISKRLDRIEAIPDRFISGVTKMQSEIYSELLTILSELNVGSGFKLTNENLIRIDTLMDQYYTVLKNGKYGSYVNWFLGEFRKQELLNDDFFELEHNAVASAVAKATYTAARSKMLRSLIGDDFKTNFINVIKDQLIGSLQGGADFEELKSDLFGLFNQTTREPQLENWVKQVSSDSFAGADRSYNVAVANDLGLAFFGYSGGIIKHSRDFCIERDGKYFHVNEAYDWVSLQWAGKFRNTTVQNILKWLGGYLCQHVLTFRSLVNIPMKVIRRNIDNGNFVPSEAEKSLLNL